MSETLFERSNSAGLRLNVDRSAGVISGVKILGLTSSNGREYKLDAIRSATGLYEGVKVNIDHADDGPLGKGPPLSYRNRFGMLRNIVARATGLFGDLHFNPKHPIAEQLAWDAVNAPGSVGLSHNIEADVTRKGSTIIVEKITSVKSVDIVAEPATTEGLFESSAACRPITHATFLESVTGCSPDSAADFLRSITY